MIYFPDLSEHQDSVDFVALRKQTNCVSHRVSYGYRLDHKIQSRLAEIREQNFDLVIWYLFLRASQAVDKQTKAVIDCVGNLRQGEFLCVDWETDGQSIPSVSDRDKAAANFERRYNRPTIVYTYESLAKQHPIDRIFWLSKPSFKPTIKYDIWQFSNGVISPKEFPPVKFMGVKYGCGFCDANMITEEKLEELLRLAGGKRQMKTWELVRQFDEQNFKIFDVKTSALDENGNGYVHFNGADGLPRIEFDKHHSTSNIGANPPVDGYWKMPVSSINNKDGCLLITFIGGQPEGEFSFREICFS